MTILDKKTSTIKQLAKKYDKEVAKEIALDYYKMLQRMEKTAEMNKKDSEHLLQQGYTIINEAKSGRYHLFLIKQPRIITQALGAQYQLGFNKEIKGKQTSITEYAYARDDQQVKILEFGAKRMPVIPKELFTVLNGWVQEYGNIIVGAGSNELTEKYKRILLKLLHRVDVIPKNYEGKNFFILSPSKTKTNKLKIKVAEPRGLNKSTPKGEVDRPLHRKKIRYVTIGEVLDYVVKTEDWDEKEMTIVINNLLDRMKLIIEAINKTALQYKAKLMLPLDSMKQLLVALPKNTPQLTEVEVTVDESTVGESIVGEFIDTLDASLPGLISDLKALGVEYIYITPMLKKIELPEIPELRIKNKKFLIEQVRKSIPMNQQTLREDNLDFLPELAQPTLTIGRPPQEVGYTPPKKQRETITFKPQQFDCIELENFLSILIDDSETFKWVVEMINPHKRAQQGNLLMAEKLREIGLKMKLTPQEIEACFGLNYFVPVETGLKILVDPTIRHLIPGIIPSGPAAEKRFKRLLERIEALGVPYLNMTQ